MSLELGELGTLDGEMAGEGLGLAMTSDCNTGARLSPWAAVSLVQSGTRFLRIDGVADVAKSRPPWGASAIRDTACPGFVWKC